MVKFLQSWLDNQRWSKSYGPKHYRSSEDRLKAVSDPPSDCPEYVYSADDNGKIIAPASARNDAISRIDASFVMRSIGKALCSGCGDIIPDGEFFFLIRQPRFDRIVLSKTTQYNEPPLHQECLDHVINVCPDIVDHDDWLVVKTNGYRLGYDVETCRVIFIPRVQGAKWERVSLYRKTKTLTKPSPIVAGFVESDKDPWPFVV